MNLYLRYFDNEIVATSIDEALDFLASQKDIHVDDFLANDLESYFKGPMPYPKRYKVRGKNYFIAIKTPCKSLPEFKERGNQPRTVKEDTQQRKEAEAALLKKYRPGWYNVGIFFRRVVQMPSTGKCHYFDTDFRVKMKATSIQDCYDRVCEHLRNRYDVDSRSQMPSIKGRNFNCEYLGMK